MGSDFPNRSHLRMFHVFQSTLPGWGATIFPDNMRYLGGISIHAPRMGSDRRRFHRHQHGNHFNPRSPDGERRGGCHALLFHLVFQSTLPGWGATPSWIWPPHWISNFNPRSPDGERLPGARGHLRRGCVCSIESGPCERVESLQMSGRF